MDDRNRENRVGMPIQDELIRLVYEAVLTPSLWPQLLEQIGGYLNALPSSNDHKIVMPDENMHDTLEAHFKRAVKIQQKVSRLENIDRAFSDILDRLPVGVILVRRDASIVTYNRMAADLLAATGSVSNIHGQLLAESVVHTQRLHGMIITALSSQLDKPMVMNIDHNGERVSLWVTTSSSNHTSLYAGEDIATLFIHSPKLQYQLPLAEFAVKHQFSKAETRLAETMLNGCHTLNDAADSLGVSKYTVRTQMKSIFTKTGVNSQIELIKKVFNDPYALIADNSTVLKLVGSSRANDKLHPESFSMTLHDGRRLQWNEFGAADGVPVMIFHSLTGVHPDYSVAESMGVRLIVPERPGAYGSDPLYGRSFMDWPEDVRQLADYLQIDTFSLLGFSVGTPYVLACADIMPERIHHITLVSCMAPIRSEQDLTGMIPLNHTAMRLANNSPELLAEFMQVLLNDLEKDSASYFDRMAEHQPDSDLAVLNKQETMAHFLDSFQAAAKENFGQVCEEIILCSANWPVDLTRYSGSASIWHGFEDPLVPIQMAQRMAERLTKPDTHFIEGEGNYIICAHWEEILSELISRQPV